MSEKLRFGVIGTSFVNILHIRSINSHPRAEVVSVCGRNTERAQEVANQNGVPHVYEDYRELIRNDNLDAVVVGTPDYLHHEMGLVAAEAGLHVACEKPMAQSLDQALDMLNVVESAGVRHLMFFSYRWIPHYARLKEMLSEGYVGQILTAELRYLSPGIPGSENPYDWHYDPRRGMGALGNQGSHIIHLAQWLVGEIDVVAALSTAQFDRLGEEKGDEDQLDDTVFMTVRFAEDVIGSIHASASAVTPGQEQLISIRGTDGTLEAGSDADGFWLAGAKPGESLKRIAGPDDLWENVDLSKSWLGRFAETTQKQSVWARLLIDDIVTDHQSEPNLRDGAKAQAVMEAAKRSSLSGAAETVSDV